MMEKLKRSIYDSRSSPPLTQFFTGEEKTPCECRSGRSLGTIVISLFLLIYSIIFIIASGCSSASSPQSTHLKPEAIAAKVDSLLSPLVRGGLLSGSILIAHNGRIVLTKGYSLADREHMTPNTPSTLFRIGSITKMITAIAVMQLCERGDLEPDAPLSKYVMGVPNADQITIRHLLNHTSGLPSFDWRRSNNRPQQLSTVLEWIHELEPVSAPGEEFHYSNSGYALLAYIIEHCSKMSYIEFVQTNILGPCQMRNTGLYSMDDPPTGLALGYSRVEYGDYSVTERPSPLGRGPGDLYSTVLDLFQLSMVISDRKLLDPDSWADVLSPGKGSYGLGLYISELHEEPVIYHPGGLLGYMANLQYFPEREIVVINLFNCDFLLAYQVERELAAIALNKSRRTIMQYGDISTDDQIVRFIGEYDIDNSYTFTVSLDRGLLYFQETDKPKCRAYPYSDNGIYIKEINARISFEETADGRIQYTGFFGPFMVTGRRLGDE